MNKYGDLSFKTVLLQLLNKIKNNKDTPESWNNILISTIYKRKGSRKLLNNQRGIFITPVISKIFEKLIKNRISQAVENYKSLFQAGGRSNRSKADNLFILRAVIDHTLYIQSYVLFTLYDFKTRFDSLWLEDALNTLWDVGVENELLYIIYLLNKNCNITVNTPFGPPERFTIEKLVKQGTVLGPVLCSTSIGDYCKDKINPDSGTFVEKVEIRPLAFMDDLNDINTLPSRMINLNNNAVHFEKLRRLQFGTDKCEILKVGKKMVTLPKLELHAEEIEEKKVVKYLGDYFNSKGDISDLVDKRIGSITSTITDIIAFCSDLSLGNFEVHIMLQLYESIFLSKLLFNSQSWSKIKKKELEDLQHVQLRMLKQVMKVPYTTPTAGIFLELGLLPIEHLINQRKLAFLHHILNLD